MGKKTIDFEHVSYDPKLIRELEDPEYARAAEEYEKRAKAERIARYGADIGSDTAAPRQGASGSKAQGYSYEDYLAARSGAQAGPGLEEGSVGKEAPAADIQEDLWGDPIDADQAAQDEIRRQQELERLENARRQERARIAEQQELARQREQQELARQQEPTRIISQEELARQQGQEELARQQEQEELARQQEPTRIISQEELARQQEEQIRQQQAWQKARNEEEARRKQARQQEELRRQQIRQEQFRQQQIRQEQARQQQAYNEARRQGKAEALKSQKKVGRKMKPGKPPKEKKKMSKGKLVRRILLAILLIYLGAMGYLLFVTSHMDKVKTAGENFAINEQVAEDLKMYRNIAILGSDARSDEGLDGSRTDAIIILSIHRLTGETRMISVMRDSYLKIGNPNGELILDKVTHAHAFGGGLNTVEALNRSLDLNIKEFMIFNWQAVSDTVDTLGGIEVDVKKKEIKDLNHWGPETGENVGKKYHKIKEPGVQTLDGVQATTYCRIRKNSGGDSGRAGRYKKVMAAVMKKAATSPGKIGALSNQVMPEIRTNMSSLQVATLANRMPFMKMGKGISWPKKYYGGIIYDVWYAVPTTLESNVKRLHKKAFEQEGYAPSDTCLEISDEIIAETGVQ